MNIFYPRVDSRKELVAKIVEDGVIAFKKLLAPSLLSGEKILQIIDFKQLNGEIQLHVKVVQNISFIGENGVIYTNRLITLQLDDKIKFNEISNDFINSVCGLGANSTVSGIVECLGTLDDY